MSPAARSVRAALLVLGAVLAAPARGEESPEGPPPGSARVVELDARALDLTRMMLTSHAHAEQEPERIPLADVPVTVLVESGGGKPAAHTTRTDADGRFQLSLGEVAPDAKVEFVVPTDAAGGPSEPRFLAYPWNVSRGPPPTDVGFFAVGPGQLLVEKVTQVVTLQGDAETGRYLRVNQMLWLRNNSLEVAFTAQGALAHLPVPEGFELLGYFVDGDAQAPELSQAPHGGQSVAFGGPVFPAFQQEDVRLFRMVLTRAYAGDEVVDLGMHVDYPIAEYTLLLGPGLRYEPPEGGRAVALSDAGAAQEIQGVATHAWTAREVPAHATVSARVTAGHRIETSAILIPAAILLLAGGAVALGIGLSRRARSRAPARAPVEPVPTEGRESALAELERRMRRKEITSVEYAARRAALAAPVQGAPAPHPAGRVAPPPALEVPASDREELLARLEEIANRPEASGERTTERDIRTLARVVRELLRG